MNWSELIDKKIVAFRGCTQKKAYGGRKHTPLQYILFDDKETILELSEQDAYVYHDCCASARTLDLRKDAKLWERLFSKEKMDKSFGYNEPDDLSSYPF